MTSEQLKDFTDAAGAKYPLKPGTGKGVAEYNEKQIQYQAIFMLGCMHTLPDKRYDNLMKELNTLYTDLRAQDDKIPTHNYQRTQAEDDLHTYLCKAMSAVSTIRRHIRDHTS